MGVWRRASPGSGARAAITIRPGYTQPLSLAFVQASFGNKDEAFRYLDAARLARANNIAYLKADPRVDSLRDDPRWAEFARQVGLN